MDQQANSWDQFSPATLSIHLSSWGASKKVFLREHSSEAMEAIPIPPAIRTSSCTLFTDHTEEAQLCDVMGKLDVALSLSLSLLRIVFISLCPFGGRQSHAGSHYLCLSLLPASHCAAGSLTALLPTAMLRCCLLPCCLLPWRGTSKLVQGKPPKGPSSNIPCPTVSAGLIAAYTQQCRQNLHIQVQIASFVESEPRHESQV